MPKAKTEVPIAIHNLFSREIRPFHNWKEWLDRWQAAVCIEEMLGLLLVGFNVSLENHVYGEKKYDLIDRLIFYFTIADGWDNHYLLEVPGEEKRKYGFGCDKDGYVTEKGQSELRQVLAQKAFNTLCLNFFKANLKKCDMTEREKNQSKYFWETVIFSEQLFPVIQNFFRAEKEECGNDFRIRNLSNGSYRLEHQSHNEQQTLNFLLDMATFIWEWREREVYSHSSHKDDEIKWNVEMRSRVDESKPWMIELLAGFNKLGLLRKWILELDNECLAKLKEIALRNKLSRHLYPVGEDRLVATIDEACYAGSEAAWFLKEHEIKTKENNRLEKIRTAEQAIEKADRELKNLT